MSPVCRIAAGSLGSWVLLGALVAAQPQPMARDSDELGVRVYTFKYQKAVEALGLIQGLLSPRGTLELQPGSNTLVIRDTMSNLSKIVPVLHDYDHPARVFRLEIQIVRAIRAPVSPQLRSSDLPEGLTRRLRELLHYDAFELQTSADFSAQEGQQITYNLRDDYEVKFRLGSLVNNQIALFGFKFSKHGKTQISSTLHLWLDQTVSLGMAKGESSSEALMIVLTVRRTESRQKVE